MGFTDTTRSTPPPAARPRSRGFAFTEVLFAVMVLGLGFIMIAAMFPVTIRQTQATVEEANAASTAKGAIGFLQTIANEDRFPFTVPPRTPGTPTNPAYPDKDPPVVALRHSPGPGYQVRA